MWSFIVVRSPRSFGSISTSRRSENNGLSLPDHSNSLKCSWAYRRCPRSYASKSLYINLYLIQHLGFNDGKPSQTYLQFLCHLSDRQGIFRPHHFSLYEIPGRFLEFYSYRGRIRVLSFWVASQSSNQRYLVSAHIQWKSPLVSNTLFISLFTLPLKLSRLVMGICNNAYFVNTHRLRIDEKVEKC